jgi:hypothetical protein
MAVIESRVDTSSDVFCENRKVQLDLIARHDAQLELACAGGGECYADRHRSRGRLLVRERIELPERTPGELPHRSTTLRA